MRTQDAGGIFPKNQVTNPCRVLKRRRITNNQVLGKIIYNSMYISKEEATIGQIIEYDNARDGTLSGFFSCGSTNRIGGSRESNLDALGVGWEE